MNKKGISHKVNKALRFRRWSRKASAVFHSLHSAVGIGSLSVSVIRSLERKTAKISKSFAVDTEQSIINTKKVEEDIDFTSLSIGKLCQFLGIILAEKTLTLEVQKPYSSLKQIIIQAKQAIRSTKEEQGSLLSLLIY